VPDAIESLAGSEPEREGKGRAPRTKDNLAPTPVPFAKP